MADQLQEVGEPSLFKYFLDGSRHVFKVDDIAYNKQVFPVVAGQIGIGCCKRENKRMQKERFYCELVLALPDKANADEWDDVAYFASKVVKLNESDELKRLGLRFSAILPYSTSKAGATDAKLDNLAVAKIQDYMIEAEKRMVAELVKYERLGQKPQNRDKLSEVYHLLKRKFCFIKKKCILQLKFAYAIMPVGKEMWRNPCRQRTNPPTVMAYSRGILFFFL